jgi:hypothetical protein
MTDISDQTTGAQLAPEPGGTVVESGGLQFAVSFRGPAGATLRVFGDVAGDKTELLRFDDFVDGPHYHLPAAGPAIGFDRKELGEPLAWLVGQLRDHLGPLLTTAGFASIVPELDLQAVTRDADKIKAAMEDCVPAGYLRVPGVGLQRVDAEPSPGRDTADG